MGTTWKTEHCRVLWQKGGLGEKSKKKHIFLSLYNKFVVLYVKIIYLGVKQIIDIYIYRTISLSSIVSLDVKNGSCFV